MIFGRKTLLGAAAGAYAAIGIVRFPAGAAEFNWKLSTDNQPDHHTTVRLNEAAGRIKQDSNGRFEIRVFPNNTLGNSTSQILQVRQGAIEMCTASDFVLADTVPVAGITSTPFAFASAKEAFATMAGPLGKYRRDTIAKVSVHPFERTWSEGFRQIVNGQRPITVPDDLRGMKIRVPVSPILIAVFKAFGASPTPINPNEMYVALQTHLVDGVELPLATLETYKMYEVQKYVSYTNHVWSTYTIIANGDAYNALPGNLRDMLDRYVDQASVLSSNDVEKLETTLESTLRGQGMVFNKADTNAFRRTVRTAGLYGQWRDLYGAQAWTLLEKSVGTLT